MICSYKKANEMNSFSTLFGKELYMFRTDLLSIIRILITVFTAIDICHTIRSCIACLLVPSWPRYLLGYIRWHDGDNSFIEKRLYIRNLNSLCREIICSFRLLLFVICLVIFYVLGNLFFPSFRVPARSPCVMKHLTRFQVIHLVQCILFGTNLKPF